MLTGMRVVVTGGLGALGSQVVHHLEQDGHEAVVASRRTGVDLEAGTGLDPLLTGADAVVHTADTTSPRRWRSMTVGGTRAVLDAARRAGTPHVVTISIVGCERVPYPYYRAKRTADELVLASGLPATVVRATQFHPFAAQIGRALRLGPLALGVRGMRVQPVELSWVGRRMAQLATGEAPDGPRPGPDLAGPDVLDLGEIERLLAAHDGRRPPRLLPLPPLGATMRAFGPQGGILAGPDAEVGGTPFATWLAAQPR